MSGVERILGVQALVSQWTCKLRDEVIPIHGSRPSCYRITGKLKVCWLHLPFQRVASYLQYWTNMNHAVFCNQIISQPYRLNISKTKICSQLACYEHHPAMVRVWIWHPMDPIKACYFFNGHNEHLMADHWDAWCFFPLDPGDPTLRRSSSTWFGTWSGMPWRVKASAPSAPRRNDHSDR